MKLKCIGLPHPHSNCMVVTLGAGKGVKFHKGAIVDLTDEKWRLGETDDIAGIGHAILAKHSRYIQMVIDPIPAPPIAAPKNKSTQAQVKKAIANL